MRLLIAMRAAAAQGAINDVELNLDADAYVLVTSKQWAAARHWPARALDVHAHQILLDDIAYNISSISRKP